MKFYSPVRVKMVCIPAGLFFILTLLLGSSAAGTPPPERVVIDGGEFVMGGPYCEEQQGNSDWCADEVPHRVRLDRYAIDKYEVTNADYNRCVTDLRCGPNGLHEFRPRDFNRPRQPVVFVTWEDARVYCEWRGARLPTEAEWERAAQGNDPGGALFGLPYKAGAPQNVGLLHPHSLGLYDMMGNVYEWTADWLAPYPGDSLQVNPRGPSGGTMKVVRGGSWNSTRQYLRASDRVGRDPELRYSDAGFRCAQSLPRKG